MTTLAAQDAKEIMSKFFKFLKFFRLEKKFYREAVDKLNVKKSPDKILKIL